LEHPLLVLYTTLINLIYRPSSLMKNCSLCQYPPLVKTVVAQ